MYSQPSDYNSNAKLSKEVLEYQINRFLSIETFNLCLYNGKKDIKRKRERERRKC